MVDKNHKQLSIRRQCSLLSVNRCRLYYKTRPVDTNNLKVMNLIDAEFTEHPVTGVERMRRILRRDYGLVVNHKRIRRLMRNMSLMAVYPRPRTTENIIEHARYPCLLKAMNIGSPNQVWCSDITYIRMRRGFMYLVAIMDYYSRFVLSWSVSNTLESLFCLDALDEALQISRPQVFHSDQGKQYTCEKFVDTLKAQHIDISMSGKGRAFDNILVERLWRTVKYEEVYLQEYADGHELIRSLERYFKYYNNRRPHQGLAYQAPGEVYWSKEDSLCSAQATPSPLKANELTAATSTLNKGEIGMDNG